jgi:hypothetical protein
LENCTGSATRKGREKGDEKRGDEKSREKGKPRKGKAEKRDTQFSISREK